VNIVSRSWVSFHSTQCVDYLIVFPVDKPRSPSRGSDWLEVFEPNVKRREARSGGRAAARPLPRHSARRAWLIRARNVKLATTDRRAALPPLGFRPCSTYGGEVLRSVYAVESCRVDGGRTHRRANACRALSLLWDCHEAPGDSLRGCVTRNADRRSDAAPRCWSILSCHLACVARESERERERERESVSRPRLRSSRRVGKTRRKEEEEDREDRRGRDRHRRRDAASTQAAVPAASRLLRLQGRRRGVPLRGYERDI